MQKTQVLRIVSQFIAQHCWPEAPEEVVFLRSLHRHVFHVIVKIPTVGDRQLEFFMVQTRLNNFLKAHFEGRVLGRSSCEVMAEKIGTFLIEEYNLSSIEVEVNEDGENGSIISLQKEESLPQPTTRQSDCVVIATEAEVKSRVRDVGEAINKNFAGQTLKVLYEPESFMYVSDLATHLADVNVSFICGAFQELLPSIGGGETAGCSVLIVMGVMDHQKRLASANLISYSVGTNVQNVVISTLLDVTGDNVKRDYTCFSTTNSLSRTEVVGYGFNGAVPYGHHRFLGVLED